MIGSRIFFKNIKSIGRLNCRPSLLPTDEGGQIWLPSALGDHVWQPEAKGGKFWLPMALGSQAQPPKDQGFGRPLQDLGCLRLAALRLAKKWVKLFTFFSLQNQSTGSFVIILKIFFFAYYSLFSHHLVLQNTFLLFWVKGSYLNCI